MSDSQRVPDGSADAQERAAATEDYGGVPISEQELAEVWTTGDAADTGDAGAADTTGADPDAETDTVTSTDAGETGDVKPEVPTDDPEPVEPA